uniref:WRKY transcription factor 18 n=1 Tax=Santalum album TaxID=35974 RepID=A0A650C2W0_SANAL|nr:WRKY transcription factor 18 [Santalum album]
MVMAGSGIDDHAAIIGDWMPPTPSPRTLFSSVLGTEFDGKTPGGNGSDGHFLGRSEHVASNTNGQFTQSNASSPEHKFNSRGGLVERMAARAGFNAPKLNTENIRSSDLSLNSDVRSPYLTIPPGLSPTTLLESPVFLSNSLAQPSPTTGKFPFLPNVNARSSLLISEASDGHKDNLFEDTNASPFEFKPLAESASSFSLGGAGKISQATVPQKRFSSIEGSVHSENSSQSQSVDPIKPHSQNQNNLQPDFFRSSTENGIGPNTNPMNARVSDMAGGSEGDQKGGGDSVAGGVPSEDGYNWRKYGQKQVKGSEYPRSYYKCTHPNCQVKKKVERSHEGQIVEIIYKGAHNHEKPPLNRRSALGSCAPLDEMQPQSGAADSNVVIWATTQNETSMGTPPDNIEVTSSVSVSPDYCNLTTTNSLQAQNGTQFESGDAVDASSTFSNDEDEDDCGTHGSVSLGYDGEGDESESKRRKIEAYAADMSGATRAIREPRVVVQTTSEVDILDDGYRWRKYGQKVVKGNPNPRSYYKCTNAGCNVRKHVERASHDLKSVITTYEGKHNHDVPAARNSSHANSGSSNTAAAAQHAGVSAVQPHAQRAEPARFERPTFPGSFSFPRPGTSPGFSFGMTQPYLGGNLPLLPVNPYLGQQQQQRQINDLGFMLPKQEPKVEPASDLSLNVAGGPPSVYQQIMSRFPLGPQM